MTAQSKVYWSEEREEIGIRFYDRTFGYLMDVGLSGGYLLSIDWAEWSFIGDL